MTRNSGCYAPFFLAPSEGWGLIAPPGIGPLALYCEVGCSDFNFLAHFFWPSVDLLEKPIEELWYNIPMP